MTSAATWRVTATITRIHKSPRYVVSVRAIKRHDPLKLHRIQLVGPSGKRRLKVTLTPPDQTRKTPIAYKGRKR